MDFLFGYLVSYYISSPIEEANRFLRNEKILFVRALYRFFLAYAKKIGLIFHAFFFCAKPRGELISLCVVIAIAKITFPFKSHKLFKLYIIRTAKKVNMEWRAAAEKKNTHWCIHIGERRLIARVCVCESMCYNLPGNIGDNEVECEFSVKWIVRNSGYAYGDEVQWDIYQSDEIKSKRREMGTREGGWKIKWKMKPKCWASEKSRREREENGRGSQSM